MPDMPVRNNAQGADLAEARAADLVVLVRGHGSCVVGDSIPVAGYRAYHTQIHAALRQQAIALRGTVTYVDREEAACTDKTNRCVIPHPWGLWKAKYFRRPDA